MASWNPPGTRTPIQLPSAAGNSRRWRGRSSLREIAVRADRRVELDSRETEAGLRRRPEHLEGEDGKIDRALNVADVVPGALLHDSLRLCQGGRRRLEEQLAQPILAIADGSTVDLEHVAEGQPLVRVRKLDEEEIGHELAPVDRKRYL